MSPEMAAVLRGQEAYIASADADRRPHLTVGEVVECDSEQVHVSGWLCPRTLENIDVNPFVSITVRLAGKGYQITGRVTEKVVDAVLDGHVPGEEGGVPQVRYRLAVVPEHVSEMSARPHTDREVPHWR